MPNSHSNQNQSPNDDTTPTEKTPRTKKKTIKDETETTPTVREIRVPPHNLEMEQAVLSALMSISESWEKISELVKEQDFYAQRHQLIFKAIQQLALVNMPYDALLVSDWLKSHHLLASAGGEEYIIHLLDNSPSSLFNMAAYADKVSGLAMLRNLITLSNDMLETAYDPKGKEAKQILDDAEGRIFAIAEQHHNSTASSGPAPINHIIKNVLNRLDELQKNKDAMTGHTTGFIELDKMTLGLQPADLIIVAGRPSMGKTTFAMNLVQSVLFQADLPVLVFSLEMPADMLALKLFSSFGGIEFGSLRSGRLNEQEWVGLTSTMGHVQEKKLYIDDTSAIPPSEMRSRTRRIARECGGQLGCIMVDYLQLMKIPGSDNRVGEISEITRGLKALAKEMRCPVIALSQLNRSLEQRPNKRPMMSDLRESGSIEQDADLIMFIYRDEVYNKDGKEPGIAEIIIGKQRNGPIGTVRLSFQGQYSRFTNLSPEYYRNQSED